MESILTLIKNGHFQLALERCDDTLRVQTSAMTQERCVLLVYKGWCLHRLQRSLSARKWIEQGASLSLGWVIDIAELIQQFYLETYLFEELIDISYRLLAIDKNNADIWHRLGVAYYYLGENRCAVEACSTARSLYDNPQSAFTLSLSMMRQGDYRQGFALYEARTKATSCQQWVTALALTIPHLFDVLSPATFRLTSSSAFLADQPRSHYRLLITSEQGLGDCIQFVRLLSLLRQKMVERIADKGSELVTVTIDLLLSQPHHSLRGVLETAEGVDCVIPVAEWSPASSADYDAYCPMMSLMHYLDLDIASIPARKQYLSAQTAHHSLWDDVSLLNPSVKRSLNVGLVLASPSIDDEQAWVNDSKNKKSVPLEKCDVLFSVEHTRFFNVQIPISENDQQYLAQHAVVDLSSRITSFTDTAAIIDHMDIVISIDTSVAHLAGAMGKPVFTLLPYVADWRWQQNRDDSPWYPTMRLFRQTSDGDWRQVMERVRQAIQQQAKRYSSIPCRNIPLHSFPQSISPLAEKAI